MSLNVNEVFLLDYIAGKKENFIIPDYMINEFGFGNKWRIKISEFLHKGYLEFTDFEDNMQFATVANLKEVCKNHGLKTSGSKSEITCTLLNNVEPHVLKHYFSENRFKLTPQGNEEILNKNIYFINKKNNYGFTNVEITEKINEVKKDIPNVSDEHIIWTLLNDHQLKECVSKNWQSYANYQYLLSEFLFNIGAETKLALEHLCNAAYITLSGLANGNYVWEPQGLSTTYVDMFDRLITALNMGLNEFALFFKEQAVELYPPVPFTYYMIDQKADIICEILKGNDFNIIAKKYPFKKPNEKSPNYNYYNYNEPEYSDNGAEEIEYKPKPQNQLKNIKQKKKRGFAWYICLTFSSLFGIIAIQSLFDKKTSDFIISMVLCIIFALGLIKNPK